MILKIFYQAYFQWFLVESLLFLFVHLSFCLFVYLFFGCCCFYRLPILPYWERQILYANLASPPLCYLNCFCPVPVDSCGSARGTLVGPPLSQPLAAASQQTSLSRPHLLLSGPCALWFSSCYLVFLVSSASVPLPDP